MLTISSGHSADYLLKAVATGRENYYTGAVAAGEPPGRWYGRGADQLGLRGLVDHQDMTALYERFVDPRDPRFRDPSQWDEASTLGHTGRAYMSEDDLYARLLDAEPDASAERRTELRTLAGKQARHNVAFHDLTYSVPKSVTVVHTAFEAMETAARAAGDEDAALAWEAHRLAVEDAMWAANNAMLDYMIEHAGYSRVGHHGGAAGRYVDAHDWVVASFFQHDSRDHDPQLHIHNAGLNRVQGPDGVWRTIDGRSLYRWRGGGGAVADRVLFERLAATLGLPSAMRPDGKSREILGVSQQVMDLFSSRRRAITPKTAELVDTFEARHSRAPNALELDRLSRQATFATRRAKTHDGETREAMLERWDASLRAEISGGLAKVAEDVLALAGCSPEAQAWSPAAVIAIALDEVQRSKAGWTLSDLTRAISDALPDHLGIAEGDRVARLLDSLARQAAGQVQGLDAERPGERELPDELRLDNGDSAYQAPGGRLYATSEQVHTERVLVAAAAQRGAATLSTAAARRFVDELAATGIELGADQAAAVMGVLTSGAQIESLVGPAGTGKSFVVGMIARAWQDPVLIDGAQRRVFGLATSQVATEVLTGEGLRASNIARWLGVQERLAAGRTGEDDEAWRLRRDDLVVVDESAMSDTAALAAIHRLVEAAGAKLLLVGDHRQLATIGAGGAMELVANAGASYELTDARRFAQEWERGASLRLRDGDESAVGEYHKHGRLIDAGAVEQAEASAMRAWLGDTLAGKHSLLIVDQNEQAARLSAQLRAELVRLGLVTEQGVPLGLQGTFAGVGDIVQTRLNGWHLAGFEGNRRGPINRDSYRVLDTRADGGLVVGLILGRDTDGELLGERIVLPGTYVNEHVALGYASTAHAGQGLTVDTSHSVVTWRTRLDSLYVALTRGRFLNTAHVATVATVDDPAQGRPDDALHRSPRAVLGHVLETSEHTRSALATATESAEEAASVRTPVELLSDAIDIATAGRVAQWLDTCVDDGLLTSHERARLAAEDGATSLTRLLRRTELAGRDPEQELRHAVGERGFDGVRQLTNVLHHRIAEGRDFEPVGSTFAEWTPRVDDPSWQRYLDSLAEAADLRREELGAQLAKDPSAWAVEAFGYPPAALQERAAWERRAGTVAAHRELTGHDDPERALGDAPKPGQVETYASWRAAWSALGRPKADADELQMTDGRLYARVRAYDREKLWAPRYVANELAATRQAAENYRRTAAIRTAEAEVADPDQRARLAREAADATALAETLDAQIVELELVDAARARWLAHTARTRVDAERAADALAARHAAREAPVPEVTAEQWLAVHDEATRADDDYREITDEADFADVELDNGRQGDERGAESGLDDIRAIAAREPRPVDEDAVRVRSTEESADSVRDAQRALAEITARVAADAEREAEESRADELARWHVEDEAVIEQEATDGAERSMDDGW